MGDGWAPPAEDVDGTWINRKEYFPTLGETPGSDIMSVGLAPDLQVTLEHMRLADRSRRSFQEPAAGRSLLPGGDGAKRWPMRDAASEPERCRQESPVKSPTCSPGRSATRAMIGLAARLPPAGHRRRRRGARLPQRIADSGR